MKHHSLKSKSLPGHALINFFLPITIILLLLAGCGQASPVTPPEKIESIKVVMDNNYPPYCFLDDEGNLQGILVDQWRLWEKKTDIKVEITGLDWSHALDRMENGEFDVIDTIFQNADREKIYDFSEPYATIDVPIYFNNQLSGITNAQSLTKGFLVAVKEGDAAINYLKGQGVVSLVRYQSYEEIIQAAQREEVAVFVIDQPPADYFLYLYQLEDQYNSTEPLYSGQFHRAVLKGNTKILSTVENGFSKISKLEYNAIQRKWYGNPLFSIQNLKMYGIIGVISLFVISLLILWNHTLRIIVRKKTKGLADSELKFRKIFEESGIGISTSNSKGEFLTGNQAILNLLGYSAEEYSRLSIKDLSHPDDLEKNITLHKELWEGKRESYSLEKRNRHKQGHYVWGRVNSTIVRDDHNKPQFMIGFFEDISERVEAQQALRESEDRYRYLFEDSPIALWEEDFSEVKQFLDDLKKKGISNLKQYLTDRPKIVADCVGKIKVIDLNKTAMKLINASNKEELLGNLNLVLINSESHKDFIEELVSIAEGKTEFAWEGVNQTLDGETIDVSLRWSAVPGYEESLSKVVISIIDITQNKAAEKALKAEEERYRNLVNNLSEGIGITDLHDNLSFSNLSADQIFGVAQNSLSGRNLEEFFTPETLEKVHKETQRRSAGESSVYELDIIRPDGELRNLQVSASPQYDIHNNVIGTLAIFHDITLQKRAEEKLILQSKIEQFLTHISTEFVSVSSEEIDGEILNSLKLLGEFEEVDRVCILRINSDNPEVFDQNEWHAKGIKSKIAKSQTIPADKLHWLMDKIAVNPVFISRISELNPDLKINFADCISSDAKSTAILPIWINQKISGIIVLEAVKTERDWQEDHKLMLQQFANILSNAIERVRLTKELENRAVTDELTGIYNRRGFSEIARNEILRAQRYKRPLGLLLFDIDHFKQINDTLGHPVGDAAIKEVVNRCNSNIREVDIIGRWGGDEFLVLLPESNLSAALLVGERLRKCIEDQPITVDDHSVNATVSMGVAMVTDTVTSLENLIHNADEALYAAKQLGRNCVVEFSQSK